MAVLVYYLAFSLFSLFTSSQYTGSTTMTIWKGGKLGPEYFFEKKISIRGIYPFEIIHVQKSLRYRTTEGEIGAGFQDNQNVWGVNVLVDNNTAL